MRQAGRPDAAGIRVPEHVKLAGTRERARRQSPVGQVVRMMDLHSGEPLKGRGCEVIIVAGTHDGGVGIEASEDGVSYRFGVWHGVIQERVAVFGSRTTIHKTAAPTRSSTASPMKKGV